jgi:hypothetical protein
VGKHNFQYLNGIDNSSSARATFYLKMSLCNWFKRILTLFSPQRKPSDYVHTSFETINVRVAQPSDLKDVVNVVLVAMPDDPAWGYRYPYRQEYKEDHLYYTRLLLESLINPSHDDWQVLVLECPSTENSTEWKIVAFAVWDVSYVNLRRHGPSYVPQDREFSISQFKVAWREDFALILKYNDALIWV